MCLIRKSCKMCSVGVPPGTGLGNTALENAQKIYVLCEKLGSS